MRQTVAVVLIAAGVGLAVYPFGLRVSLSAAGAALFLLAAGFLLDIDGG